MDATRAYLVERRSELTPRSLAKVTALLIEMQERDLAKSLIDKKKLSSSIVKDHAQRVALP